MLEQPGLQLVRATFGSSSLPLDVVLGVPTTASGSVEEACFGIQDLHTNQIDATMHHLCDGKPEGR